MWYNPRVSFTLQTGFRVGTKTRRLELCTPPVEQDALVPEIDVVQPRTEGGVRIEFDKEIGPSGTETPMIAKDHDAQVLRAFF